MRKKCCARGVEREAGEIVSMIRKNSRAIYLDDRNRARVVIPGSPITIPIGERHAMSMMLGQLLMLAPIAVASGLAWGVPGAALPIAIGGGIMLLQWALR